MYGSPTTKGLKKPRSSRRIGEAETEPGWKARGVVVTWQSWQPSEQVAPHSHVVDRNREDTWGLSDPSPRSDHTAQGSSAGEIKPHNFWL